MRLETHEGLVVDPATPEDVPLVVKGLTNDKKAYVILSDTPDSEWYVQAAGSLNEGFIVERRDGSAGDHYRGDWRVSADVLQGILVGYLRGLENWSHAITWHRVGVSFGAKQAHA